MISPLISPKPLSLVDRLKRLDVHPKTKEDYRVRTVSGGIGESPSTGCDVGGSLQSNRSWSVGADAEGGYLCVIG